MGILLQRDREGPTGIEADLQLAPSAGPFDGPQFTIRDVSPEKRDFFLEGRGIFDFARGGGSSGGSNGVNANATPPQLFYTRRIGLNKGREIPINVGERLTGKVGRYSVGMLNIETRHEDLSGTPSTNFTVLRLKRDVLRRSNVGVMFTNRSVSSTVAGSNQAFGVDGSFAFFHSVFLSGYYASSESPNLKGDNDSYQGRFEWGADRYGVKVDYLKVGDSFNPEIGLVRRGNFDRTFASARFSPRPRRIKRVRKFAWEAGIEYLNNGAGKLESRTESTRFNTEFQNSDTLALESSTNYELLLQPFAVATGVRIRRARTASATPRSPTRRGSSGRCLAASPSRWGTSTTARSQGSR